MYTYKEQSSSIIGRGMLHVKLFAFCMLFLCLFFSCSCSSAESVSCTLNVPYITQETNYYCGPASVQIIASYKGKSVSQSKLAGLSSFNYIWRLTQDLNDVGLSAYSYTKTGNGSETAFGDAIFASLVQGYPVIVHIRLSSKPNAFGYTTSEGHYVVATGAYVKNGVKYIKISDPFSAGWYNKKSGQYLDITLSELWKWHKKGNLYIISVKASKNSGTPWSQRKEFECDEDRWYVFSASEVKAWQSAASSSNKVVYTYPAASGIIITGSYPKGSKLSGNATWYRTKEGYYIKASDLMLKPQLSAEKSIGTVKHDNLSFTVESRYNNHWLTAQPYADTDKMVVVNKGEQMKVTKVILNNASPTRHYWAQVEYKGGIYYACVNNVKIVETADPDVQLSGKAFPTGNLTQGKSFDIGGTLKTKYYFTRAKGSVYVANSNNVKYAKEIGTKEFGNTCTSINLVKSNINISANGGIPFGKLDPGNYEFKLEVWYKKSTWKNQDADNVDPVKEGTEVQGPTWTSSFTIKGSSVILVTGITLDTSNKTLWIGENHYIKETVAPSNATNKKLSWSSSNNSVASVVDGKVTAVGKGTATITAAAQDNSGKKATCTITVKKPVSSISISPSTKELHLNETIKLVPSVQPTDASDTSVSWSSSNNNIVSVDQSGSITAKAVGTATITAKANDGTGKQGTCVVTVLAYVDSVTLSGANTVNVGATIKLTPSIAPSNASDQRITWSSSNSSVATVDNSGYVKGIKAGSVTITATAVDRGTKNGTFIIIVQQPVTKITLSGNSEMTSGDTLTISSTLLPSDASNKNINWSSSDTNIATVSSAGVVTAKKAGNITITATAADGFGATAKHAITIYPAVSNISVTGNTTITVGQSSTLKIEVLPSNARNKAVTWASSNTSVATVSNGVVTGINKGNAIITITSAEQNTVKRTISVTIVQPMTTLTLQGTASVVCGQSLTLTPSIQPSDASNQTLTWSTSDSTIATVVNGVVNAKKPGTVTITAKSTDGTNLSATCEVTVIRLVDNISIEGPTTLAVDGTISLVPTVSPSDASSKTMQWASSDLNIATVDANGVVLGIGRGSTIITATATDGSGVHCDYEIQVVNQIVAVKISGVGTAYVGEQLPLSATVTSESPLSDSSVTWSSNNTNIASVNSNGVVIGKANGTVTITATSNAESYYSSSVVLKVETHVSDITIVSADYADEADSLQFSVNVTPQTASNKAVHWSSSDQSIVKIDAQTGTATAVSPGTATISVSTTDGSNITRTKQITVYPRIRSVVITGDNEVNCTEQAQLSISIFPVGVRDSSVVWASSDASVLTVNSLGVVTAVANGTATISASSVADPNLVAAHVITVKTPVGKITLSGAKNLDVGDTSQVSAVIEPASASNKNIVWSSSNTSIATVDGNGLISAINNGTATITAIATDGSGVKGTIKVTVYPLPNQISISGDSELITGTTKQLTATVLPSNARNKNVTWSSSDTTVAKVSNTGLVTAVGNGTSVISATAVGNTRVTTYHEVSVTTLVASVSLTGPEKINVGEMDTVMAQVLPVTASNSNLNWESSDENVAIVDACGNVFGISAGYVAITANSIDGSDIVSRIELEIYQPIQSVSVNIQPVAYAGQVIELNAIILPEDASAPYVSWASSNENVAVIESKPEVNGECFFLHCIGAGVTRLTATATDGSNVTGYAYIQVLPYTELTQDSDTYTLYTGGETKAIIGKVSLTTDSSVRAAEAKHGAIWKIDHVNGDYAAALGINERIFSFNGFSLSNSVDLVVLGLNHTGTDTYRVTCTINGESDSCLITVSVENPSAPLPVSVTLPTTNFSGVVGEEIAVDITPVVLPTTSELPEDAELHLYGVDSFNRYGQVNMGNDELTVTFSKAGIYTAYVRYQGANYQYDAHVTFAITTPEGTVPPEIETLSIDNSLMYLLPGETAKFTINVSPSGADDATLQWSSSDPEAVAIAADGTMTAVGIGTSVITVSAGNGISASGLVVVTDSLLSIDWNPNDIIEVYVGGESKAVIQKVYLTSRASDQLTEAPTWTIKRKSGNNLTLTCEPVTATNSNGQLLYGCAIILKSVSNVGTTEYELTCSDGAHSANTTIQVNANDIEDTLPSLVKWNNNTFTGTVNQRMTLYPVVECWPTGTTLPDELTISINGDSYWNAKLKVNEYTVSRGMITFAFDEPGVYTANVVYSCSNMRYLVPITVRVADSSGNVPVRLMQLTLNETEISIKAGDTAQLNTVFAPTDATNKAVTWSSDNPSIATVSADGLVTGVANGRANITCTPADENCVSVTCAAIVEDTFTVTKYQEMDYQYLQGKVGEPVAGFRLSNGTAKRVESEGLAPVWTLSRVSGNAANVELREYNGTQFIVVTALKAGGIDTYQVTCTAGDYSWTGQTSLEVHDLGTTAPANVTLAENIYMTSVGEEIALDFTPVCEPAGTSIPSELEAEYIGIGDIYSGLADAYQYSLFTAGDRFSLSFKKPGTYLLSRQYTSCNLTYITECTIIVDNGSLNLIKCTDEDAVVYIGGQSSIAATCIIRDTSIEELYGDQLTWSAERLSGDCLTVALRADQSSASLYVVNAKEEGEEFWRVSCSFKGITDYVDITIHAVKARTSLPESATLYQTEFDGVIGNVITVPLAVECNPEGTSLPVTDDSAWSFSTDGNTKAHAVWSFENNQMRIVFSESGYYGGNLIYQSGNVSYRFPISFAITDEEDVQAGPTNLAISLSKDSVTVYPEGETQVAIVNAILTDSLDAYSLASVAAYAERNNAVWSVQTLSGNSCSLSINSESAAGIQLMLDSIAGSGDVTYQIQCSVAGKTVSVRGAVHVAASNEARPQPELKQSYFTTPTGTVLSIDASMYDHTHTIKLCSGKDSIWDNTDALAAIGYKYNTSGDLLLPVFYEAGSYVTTITNRIGNLVFNKEIIIAVYSAHALPVAPSKLSFPSALTEIEDEAFENVSANIVDLRGTAVSRIGYHAFAENHDLMRVYIPASMTVISTEAFSGCSDFVICCTEGSYADTWAQSLKYPVVYNME